MLMLKARDTAGGFTPLNAWVLVFKWFGSTTLYLIRHFKQIVLFYQIRFVWRYRSCSAFYGASAVVLLHRSAGLCHW